MTLKRILAALTIVVAASCGGDPVPQVTQTLTFADVDAFLASDAWEHESGQRRKVVFIGIDGAGWPFIDRLIAEGALPNLARLKAEGSYGPLRSIPCHYSPPAWTTMFTGHEPATTGVYSFGKWNEGEQEFVSVSAEDVHVAPVWDIASYAGLKVATVNVPVTYPTHPINGLMVSGMMTPIDAGDPLRLRPVSDVPAEELFGPEDRSFSTPRSLAVEDDLNMLLWTILDTTDDGTTNYDRVRVTVHAKDAANEAATHIFRVGDYSPWLRIRARRDGETSDGWCKIRISPNAEPHVSPTFYRIDDLYVYPESLIDELSDEFGYYLPTKFMARPMVTSATDDACGHATFLYDYDDWDLFMYVFTQSDNIHHLIGLDSGAADVYRKLDETIGQLVERVGDDGTIVIASDHGFGAYTIGIDMNQLLHAAGLLEWRADGAIDYGGTVVFHNLWHLYFNDDLMTEAELSKRGIRFGSGEASRQALMRYLNDVAGKLSINDPNSKRDIPLELTLLPDDAVGDAPDVFVTGTYDDFMVDFWNIKAPTPSVLRRLEGSERWNHVRDGIYLMWGRGVAAAGDTGLQDIHNIAPTLLTLLGLPAAQDMAGAVIENAIERATNPYIVPNYGVVRGNRVARDVDDESLQKKLRSLGYIR